MQPITIKRAYDPPAASDGCRILIDRLWPRGLSKSKAKIDLWLKEVAPSDSLGKWFDHDSSKWAIFCERYAKELEGSPGPVGVLQTRIRSEPVTLLFGSREQRFKQCRRAQDVARAQMMIDSTAHRR